MRTYIVDGIKIEIGAQVIAVRHDGKTISPKEQKKSSILQRGKGLISELWRNNYFRRQSKSFLLVKGSEIALRSFSLTQGLFILRQIIKPYEETILELLRSIEWTDLIFCVDIGFALGILTTCLLIHLKRSFLNWINWKGDKTS